MVKYKLIPHLDASDFPNSVNEELTNAEYSTHYQDDNAYINKEELPITFAWLKENTDLLKDGKESILISWSST